MPLRAPTRPRRLQGALRRGKATPRPLRPTQSLCGLRRGLPGRRQPRRLRLVISRRQRRQFRRGRSKNRRPRGRPLRRRHRTAVPLGWRRFLASSTRRSASRVTTRLPRSAPRQRVRPPQRPVGQFHLVNLTILLSHDVRGPPRRPLPRRDQRPLPAPPVRSRPTSPQRTRFRAEAGQRLGSTAWIPAESAPRAVPTWTPPAALRECLPRKPRP